MNWKHFCILFCLSLTLLACSAISGGAREGVYDGITGLFSGGGDASDGDASSERSYSGESQSVPWPSDSTWARYGLAGLAQPTGTTITGAALYRGQYIVGLSNGGESACKDLISQIDAIAGAELTTDVTVANGNMKGWSLAEGSVQLNCDYVNGDVVITAN